MIKSYHFFDLIRKVNKELRLDEAVNIQNFASSECYKSAFLRTSNAMALYSKIKATEAMKKFESTYNACLVLGKYEGKFILRINY